MAVASPPPMQSAATPRLRSCRSSACSNVTMRRGAGRADWVAKGAGAAVDVEAVARNGEVALCRHGDNRESLVDLEKIDITDAPAGLRHELADRGDRRRCVPGGFLGMRGMRLDFGEDRQSLAFGD